MISQQPNAKKIVLRHPPETKSIIGFHQCCVTHSNDHAQKASVKYVARNDNIHSLQQHIYYGINTIMEGNLLSGEWPSLEN